MKNTGRTMGFLASKPTFDLFKGTFEVRVRDRVIELGYWYWYWYW